MVKNVLFLIVGCFIGWGLHCIGKPKESVLETNVVRFDTIVEEVYTKVPMKEQIYISKTDTLFRSIHDTTLIERFKTDTTSDLVLINSYKDSINSDNFKLEYEILTLGELIKFTPTITTFYSTPEPLVKKVKPKWMISGAVSNKQNMKVGVGYRGITFETEFSNKFNQFFVGYQYQF